MIDLRIDPWCANCTEFVPETKTIEYVALDKFDYNRGDDCMVDTFIACEHRNRCTSIVNYLKGQK